MYLTTKEAAKVLGVTPQTLRKFIKIPDKIDKTSGITYFYLESTIYKVKAQRDNGTFDFPKVRKAVQRPCFACGKLTGNRSQLCKECAPMFEVDDYFHTMKPLKTQDRPCPRCGAKGLKEDEYLCRSCALSWHREGVLDEHQAYGEVNL